uniref:Uncharacterized protein n=1 Tax=Meloidogyne enterolobii TaxID=390850 RepID=A0A6V7VVY6_MELEN|nr:unnamed protein product [Meloidogyne enterolobii]
MNKKEQNPLGDWRFCWGGNYGNINNYYSNKTEDETNSSTIAEDKEEESLKDSCVSCCLSQNIIESLTQRIEKLENVVYESTKDKKEKFQNIEQQNNENKDKTANLEKIFYQKDIKINLLESEIKKQISDLQSNLYKYLFEFQIEINQLKKENETNIKIIKQKNKEKYQQLESENTSKISYLEEIIHQKDVKITSLEKDNKQTNHLIQSLETKIKQNENEYLNKINVLEENIQQMEGLIKLLEIKNKMESKSNETIDNLNKKIVKLTEVQEDLISYVASNRTKYIQIKNKWKNIDDRRKCCEDNCINTETPSRLCKNGNGFIEIIDDTNIIYNYNYDPWTGKDNNAWIDAENKFNKPKDNCFFASLFYYEITLTTEKISEYTCFGFRNIEGYIVLADGYIDYLSPLNAKVIRYKIPLFSSNCGDILGFGLVFPSTKMLEKRPYVFFTQNGKQIGKAVSLQEEDGDSFYLYAVLNCCSIEANFGNDLKAKPFCYDISKHLFVEEFYN